MPRVPSTASFRLKKRALEGSHTPSTLQKGHRSLSTSEGGGRVEGEEEVEKEKKKKKKGGKFQSGLQSRRGARLSCDIGPTGQPGLWQINSTPRKRLWDDQIRVSHDQSVVTKNGYLAIGNASLFRYPKLVVMKT